MKTLDNVSLLELLPPNLRNDPDMIAASKVNDTWNLKILHAIEKILIWSNIDNMESYIIDALAIQLHIDFYDQTLSLEKRREIVKNSDRWHAIKGTKGAIEEILSSVFDNATLEEWFDFDGDPYTFRIKTQALSSIESLSKFYNVLENSKNIRSKLVGIYYENESNITSKITIGLEDKKEYEFLVSPYNMYKDLEPYTYEDLEVYTYQELEVIKLP